MQACVGSPRSVVWRELLVYTAVALTVLAGRESGATTLRPAATFAAPFEAPTGRTIAVARGENLQTAIDQAQLGDTLVLEAGATFQGPIMLPNKTSGSGWIYIQSSALTRLPSAGTRVSPADAVHMPVILTGPFDQSAILTSGAAHHYRFVGIEVRPLAGQFVTNLVRIGGGETAVADLPSHIVFDRCYLHGDPVAGGRRGVAMDGTHVAVMDSYVADFKEVGRDSQALWAHNTPGPLKIFNNYLEAAGENVMFGGADPTIPNVVPSDIEIRGNRVYKPLTWKGASWSVKNLLEFKNAQRVHVSRNHFENNWPASQNGFAVLVTPRNQDGTAPWSVTRDIEIAANIFLNVAHGFNIMGRDDTHESQLTGGILVRNNEVYVSGPRGDGADGRAFQLHASPADVAIDHNTVVFHGIGGSFLSWRRIRRRPTASASRTTCSRRRCTASSAPARAWGSRRSMRTSETGRLRRT
jgi:hypothetical protein